MHAPAPEPASFVHPAEALPQRLRGGVVAIGNFDGVHRGHQAVMAEVTGAARRMGAPSLVLTFEPHPRTVFRPDAPVYRITPPEEKAEVLAALGLSGMAVATFDRAFSGLSADAFVDDVLGARLGARHVMVGRDFRYGTGRSGDIDHLVARGRRDGFTVTALDLVAAAEGEPISSTRVRAALAAGEVERANDLLGYRHFVVGEVVHGEKRGRQMNYPTANQKLGEDCRLRHGIYAVRALADGVWREGVASFGRRPTFDDGAPLLETFLFDFSDDLYGRRMKVAFLAFLRPELKFDGMDALVAQMDRDSAEARAVHAVARPLGDLDRRLTFDPPPP